MHIYANEPKTMHSKKINKVVSKLTAEEIIWSKVSFWGGKLEFCLKVARGLLYGTLNIEKLFEEWAKSDVKVMKVSGFVLLSHRNIQTCCLYFSAHFIDLCYSGLMTLLQ